MHLVEEQGCIRVCVNQENATLPICDRVDVLVCGGGVAGIAATIAAAKMGAKTLLVERAGFLGGTATGSLMGLIVIPFRELTGFPAEFFTRLSLEHEAGTGNVVPWDTEGYKLTALEMVMESGADVLLYTWFSEPLMVDNRVQGVAIENKSGRQAILAKVVIDATGDGDVAARAGVPFVKGREEDGAMRPATVMGRIANVDLYKLKEWIDTHPEDVAQDPGRHVFDLDTGEIRIDGFFSVMDEAKRSSLVDQETPMNYLRFSAVVDPKNIAHADVIINCTRVYGIDGTNARDITRAEIEGRRQLKDAVKVCKTLLPGFENSYLIDTSSFLGVRETRRIRGQYTLTYENIAEKEHFSDSVAVMTSVDYGTAEIHGPEKGHEGSASDTWARQMVLPLTRFEFPLRCMLPKEHKNLIVAGRCASMTHDAEKFTRNMAPIGLMGQVAGMLAGLVTQREDSWDNLPIAKLREELVHNGVPVNL